MFVLDEADEMLSRGFKDQIYDVFRKMPSNAQVCSTNMFIFDNAQVILLSATMPPDVLEVTKRFMRDPVRILVKKEELTLEGIKQFYVQVEKEVSNWNVNHFQFQCDHLRNGNWKHYVIYMKHSLLLKL